MKLQPVPLHREFNELGDRNYFSVITWNQRQPHSFDAGESCSLVNGFVEMEQHPPCLALRDGPGFGAMAWCSKRGGLSFPGPTRSLIAATLRVCNRRETPDYCLTLGRLTMRHHGSRPILAIAAVCILAGTMLTACTSPSSQTTSAQTTAEPAPMPAPPPTNYKK
jgi:hypothetical protein